MWTCTFAEIVRKSRPLTCIYWNNVMMTVVVNMICMIGRFPLETVPVTCGVCACCWWLWFGRQTTVYVVLRISGVFIRSAACCEHAFLRPSASLYSTTRVPSTPPITPLHALARFCGSSGWVINCASVWLSYIPQSIYNNHQLCSIAIRRLEIRNYTAPLLFKNYDIFVSLV